MSKGFASSYRIVLLAGGLFACFGALGVRLVWLHVVGREALLRNITKAREQLIVETARRGDILDARGAILATSRSLIVLGVDPKSLRPQDEQKWPRLARLIGMPEAELRRIFTTRFRGPAALHPAPAALPAAEPAGLVFNLGLTPVPAPRPALSPGAAAVAGPADDDSDLETVADESGRRAIRWAKLGDAVSEPLFDEIERLGIRGVYGRREYRRAYPNNQLAAHLIGYVDRDQRPMAGMEFHADFYLRGQNGWRVGERDGRNRELAQFRTREVPRADGYSVSLSIVSAVQDIVEQELAHIAQRFQPLKATIIVSEPRTGFILGMGNHPSFNLNEFNKVPREEQASMKNIAVADIYEPGSVFKIVAAAAALEEGLVNPGTKFNCALDKVEYQHRILKLPGEDHRFDQDELTVAEILSRSSNRGAARLGLELGAERLHRYASAFGFGHPLGFPVGGEVGGILRRPEHWNPIDITRIPMGHTVAATALQMHQAMSVIASGGVLFRPQITRQIRDAAGETIFLRKDGVEIRRVLSERTAQTMAAMLMAVASKQGTAPESAIDGFDVAGKTGTTIKLIDGKYDSRHHVASFVGFFPATRPEVVISVIVDGADTHAPGGVAYGRTVAAPSFKRMGEQLIPILGIKSNRQPVRPAGLVAASEGGGR
ncbi:MAG: penicillin-binding protein 2 [Verrucomicrobia bacterium]|nr:penicillin-binding protein 2 [Verrucomicrobiota bacterium]